jgi:hypothetical protein
MVKQVQRYWVDAPHSPDGRDIQNDHEPEAEQWSRNFMVR